ncbi:MAG TPA: hypothetical protein VNC82_18095 [Candidatus Limnocylindria bacterium]|nr:hypothetical protein [Candidatus Limnocylindria bacterium]
MSDRTIVVERRFRGPDMGGGTGNGGYFCGLVAVAAGPGTRSVEIRRASGVPLDRPLTVRTVPDGAEVHDDEGLIARTPGEAITVTAPAPPPVEVAVWISARFLEQLESGEVLHQFPECFVCGHRRAPGDGLRLFVGPLDQKAGTWVGAWRPAAGFLDEAGLVRPELVWSALDCPGGWAITGPANTGTLQVEILGPVDGRQDLIVMGWPMPAASARPGSRRRYAGTAMFDARGGLLARGAAIWVAPRAA